ncbi:hypothetical protein N7520_008420 [Penicillium odoratum]|uniref:uncharacterized protein n=1 Tax=Penicillium odoratum TaxID=1167516 RepID=UPI00254863D6|nr:uncharacterized protein N7520_008420 [Penicillium odoratum]KAJ5761264.1 hypothetical protein N7520_008420 [Penicillium odoratum]
MSIPRHLALETIGAKVTLIQEPQEAWSSIINKQPAYSHTYHSVPMGIVNVGTTGDAIKVDLNFSAASTASEFAIAVRASTDSAEQTLVGYDFVNKQTFASVYRGPLKPDVNNNVQLSIFVDRSRVEVFGGLGETTLTAQIFPSSDAIHTHLVSTGGATKGVNVKIYNITSTWK